jgi:hypothetical protein
VDAPTERAGLDHPAVAGESEGHISVDQNATTRTISAILITSQARTCPADAGAHPPRYFTTMTPVMNGWMEQWYLTVPAVAKVWV